MKKQFYWKLNTKDKILAFIINFLNKVFGVDIHMIVSESFYENDTYVISEPYCLGCKGTKRNFNITHQ